MSLMRAVAEANLQEIPRSPKKSYARKLSRHAIWISILLHFLLVGGSSVMLVLAPPEEDQRKPALDIPSYVYHDPVETVTKPTPSPQKKTMPTEKMGIEKSTFASSAEVQNAIRDTSHSLTRNTQAVHLIGDKNVDKPLLTLLGRALSRHLIYPRSAVDFNVKGVVLVGFTLYPDGHLTDVSVVKPSNAAVLDQAALKAVNLMTPGSGVSLYLKEPKYLVVGIIFR